MDILKIKIALVIIASNILPLSNIAIIKETGKCELNFYRNNLKSKCIIVWLFRLFLLLSVPTCLLSSLTIILTMSTFDLVPCGVQKARLFTWHRHTNCSVLDSFARSPSRTYKFWWGQWEQHLSYNSEQLFGNCFGISNGNYSLGLQ